MGSEQRTADGVLRVRVQSCARPHLDVLGRYADAAAGRALPELAQFGAARGVDEVAQGERVLDVLATPEAEGPQDGPEGLAPVGQDVRVARG